MRTSVLFASWIAIGVACCSVVAAPDPNQLQYDSDDDMIVTGYSWIQTYANTSLDSEYRGCPPGDPNCTVACTFDSSDPLSNSGLNYRFGTCLQNLSSSSSSDHCDPVIHETAMGSASLNSGWVCSANKAAIGYSAEFSSSASASAFLVGSNLDQSRGTAATTESISFDFFIPGNGTVYITKSVMTTTNSCGTLVSSGWSLSGPGTAVSWGASRYDSGSDDYEDSREIAVSRGTHTFSASFSASADEYVAGGTSCGCSTPCDLSEGCGVGATFQVLLRYYPKCVLPGDLTGDGDVDTEDLAILLSAYGSSALDLPDGDYNPDADLDGDGDVDLTDYTTLISNYSESC